MSVSYQDIAKMIDHSLLNPSLTISDLEAGCQLALDYNVASVCVMPFYLRRCAEMLQGSTIKASTTIGFPHGGHSTATKIEEAKHALLDGGAELDMVINISQALSGNWDYVENEIAEINTITHEHGQKLKVIFENCYLNKNHKIMLCKICSDLGVDWVKTSTGYGSSGATIEDLKLMLEYSAPSVQVKAAGGIRDLDALLAVRDLGVTRVGASRTRDILDECKRHLG